MSQTPAPPSKQPLPESAKKVFNGIVFDVFQWEQVQFDGTVKIFEKLKRAATVLVLPITVEGKFVFSEEDQPGKQPFFGLLGGGAHDGEDPLDAAKRELLEETGFEAEEFVLIEAVQPVSKIEWPVYTYIARGCKKVGDQELDSGEKIELKFLAFEETVELMAKDDFADREGAMPRLAIHALYNSQKREELQRLLLGEA